jgi:two-component system, OmpR family, response regulator RegX3
MRDEKALSTRHLENGVDSSRSNEGDLYARESIVCLTTDPTFANAIERLLAPNGYHIAIARSVSGLGLLDRSGPTVALIDRRLDIIAELRSKMIFRKMPSIAILPLGHQFSEEEYIRDLEKGYDIIFSSDRYRELIAHIRAIFRRYRSEQVASSMLKVGSLEMDLSRYEVRVEGAVKPLTYKEFEILRHLLLSAGHVLSRQELLNRVWGEDYALEEHALDVHIHSLRRKIEPDAANPQFIITVRGVGYKLQA